MHSIFRAYDVRGIYGKDITEKRMELIGNSLARFLKDKGVVIGRDSRVSSEGLSEAFIRGFAKTSKNVVDVGMLPLGAGMFYAWRRRIPYAYITGSHLPKEWNGIKFFHKNALGFLEEDNYRVRDLFLEGNPLERGKGRVERKDTDGVLEEYVNFLLSKIKPRGKLRIVLDCGNGAAGVVARKLFEKAGFRVEVIFEEPDGRFPNRSPDNFEDPLTELRKVVEGADFGIAYDGDGDRAAVLDNEGNVLSPEQTSYIILSELLKGEKGPIVANVECTRAIDYIANRFGREVRRVKVGHTFLMEGVKKFRASFGVETSGHYVIPSLFPADDSLAVSYYFACILSGMGGRLSDIAKKIPSYPFQRINFDCEDERKFLVMEKLKSKISKGYEKVNTLDGVRIDLENGWVLIRASNTSPKIRLTVEGRGEKDLVSIRGRFSGLVREAIKSEQ